VLIFTLLGLNKHKHAIIPLLLQLILSAVFIFLTLIWKFENILLIAGSQVIGIGLGTILLFQICSHLISFKWEWKEYGSAVGAVLLSILIIKLISFWIPETQPWNLVRIILTAFFFLILMRKKIWDASIDRSIYNFFRRRISEIRN
jgi:hypothetical protein